MGLADTLMVGQVGVPSLAACASVNAVGHIPMAIGFGMFSSVSVLVSRAFGASQPAKAGEALRHGLILSLIFGIISAAGMYFISSRMGLLGQPEETLQLARPYCVLFGISILPVIFAHVLKQFGESLNRPWAPTWIFLGGVGLNLALNWILIFGKFGIPAMGLEGAGWATLAARLAIALATLLDVLLSRKIRGYLPARWFYRLDLSCFKSLIQLGSPVGFQHLMEVGAFALAGLMAGWIRAEALAAHQIAITLAATTFMCPLGIGMAVCVRIGHAWGAGKVKRLQRIGWVGILMAILLMSLFGLSFSIFRFQVAGWFTNDPVTLALTAKLLLIAAIFQIADGSQVTAISALRGLADVRQPAKMAAFSYWGVAMPVAFALAFGFDLGVVGIWIGLALGLGTAAVVLILRFRRKTVSISPPEE